MFMVIIGGSGSGKSEYAENIAVKLHTALKTDNIIYIATMEPYGEEAQKKIERHRKMRAEKGFKTIECYSGLKNLEIKAESVVLLECMSNLTANEMFNRNNKNTLYDIMEGICKISANCSAFIVVTNDVFSDDLNYDKEILKYIKCLGEINFKMSLMADIVTEVVCGIPVNIKGGETNDY
ncbi:MAG: bifunctional adenosylcobinamide kinase/adenosylcobinamide-phosphate guanylyltransferase [Clostridia bacterium]|nr:bifunctional adenosylcobinamide kinase/adenosylcobinamide-phosphate guanylyltransferase [Clostridia bacterium]